MARSHARILVSIWRDPDWVARSMAAQWVYTAILSQQKLTLVGSLDVTPAKWAALAADLTRADVEKALSELEEHRYVVVDHDTEELVIRTFTAHDLEPNRINQNLAKGLWGHWACIASHHLRTLTVTDMPEPVWARLEPHAPTDATRIRRSARLEPATADPVATGNTTPGSNLLPPPSSHLSPAPHRDQPPGSDWRIVDHPGPDHYRLDDDHRATNAAGLELVRTQTHRTRRPPDPAA